MRIADAVAVLDRLAPPELAEPWDNVGLLLGDPDAPLTGPVLLTIDLTAAALEEALAARASLVVAYHPPIFQPLRRLTATDRGQAVLLRAARAGVALYSPHTALDAAPGGVTDWLADALGASGDRRALVPARPATPGATHKIVTFVPSADVDRVRDALASAGAGRIGAYERCSFSVAGEGTFQGDASTDPAVGRAGAFERVEERRLEMVCDERALALLLETLRAFHPYEEPAVDVYALAPAPSRAAGAGRRVTLDHPASPREIAARLRDALGLPMVHLADASREAPVSRVAFCPGSGGSLLGAAIAQGCECFVTGELKHHDVLAALAEGVSVVLAGHTQTERGYLPTLGARLREALPGVEPMVSRADADPLAAV